MEQIDETCIFIIDHVKKSSNSHCLVLSILCKRKEKKLFETLSCNYNIFIYCTNLSSDILNLDSMAWGIPP